jgi:hypothetical protein
VFSVNSNNRRISLKKLTSINWVVCSTGKEVTLLSVGAEDGAVLLSAASDDCLLATAANGSIGNVPPIELSVSHDLLLHCNF